MFFSETYRSKPSLFRRGQATTVKVGEPRPNEASRREGQADTAIEGMMETARRAETGIGEAYDKFGVEGTYGQANEAMRLLDPDRMRRIAGTDQSQSYQNAWGQQQRDLSRMGVDPTSGRYASLQAGWGRAMAAAVAGAKTKASFEGAAEKAQLSQGLAGLSGSLATQLAQLGIGAGSLGVQAQREAGQYYSDQMQGSAEMAGWGSAFGGGSSRKVDMSVKKTTRLGDGPMQTRGMRW